MAKTSTKRATTSNGGIVKSGALKGYTVCGTCRRKIKDIAPHMAAHKSNKIGASGRRTDRSKTERLAWALRYNGRPATKSAKDLDDEQRVKRLGKTERAKAVLA